MIWTPAFAGVSGRLLHAGAEKQYSWSLTRAEFVNEIRRG